MTRFVALFRGINVGKAKRIAMADLRALLESLGYTNVRTLLNSGNAVFDATGAKASVHAAGIESALAARLGVKATVIVKSAKEVAAIVDDNPLAGSVVDPSKLLVVFTRDAASLAALASLAHGMRDADDFHVGRHAAYMWCANGSLQSEVAVALLGKLEGRGTTRNWATTRKLHDLLSAEREEPPRVAGEDRVRVGASPA